MCYNNVVYARDRKSAKVKATCRKHESITKVEYNFNGQGFITNDTFDATSSLSQELTLTVKATDNKGKDYTITVEPSNFIWQNNHVNQASNYKNG